MILDEKIMEEPEAIQRRKKNLEKEGKYFVIGGTEKDPSMLPIYYHDIFYVVVLSLLRWQSFFSHFFFVNTVLAGKTYMSCIIVELACGILKQIFQVLQFGLHP